MKARFTITILFLVIPSTVVLRADDCDREFNCNRFEKCGQAVNQRSADAFPWTEVISILGIVATAGASIYTMHKTTDTQRKIAVSQLRASTVSASRQKWADKLREQAGEFIPLAINLSLERYPEEEKRRAAVVRLLELNIQIQLLITGSSDDENKLRFFLQAIYQQADTIGLDNPPEFITYLHGRITELKDLTRAVIHNEWKRIGKEIED